MDRDELARVIADPGKTVGYRGDDESLSQWEARAALAYFREYLGREETVEAAARTMQESKAWPAVHQAGTAELLARAALTTIGDHGNR